METSPLTNNLLDFLGEEPVFGTDPNPAKLLQQGQVAQAWLLETYLAAWLELIGGLVDCEYPIALAFRPSLRAIARLAELIDPGLSLPEQIEQLTSMQTYLKSTLKMMNTVPREREFQWGIWARDVPMSIAYGFEEVEFLDPLVCRDIAPVCMYAAFLVSLVVTDSGVAEEISSKMFGELPRQLVELLRSLPAVPEA